MRIMCGAVILLVYISDSQNQFGSHALQTGARYKEQGEGNYLVDMRQTQEHKQTHQHRNTPNGYSVIRTRNRHKQNPRENCKNTSLAQGEVKRENAVHVSQPFTRQMFSVLKNPLMDSTSTSVSSILNSKVNALYIMSKNPSNSYTALTRRKVGANSASFSSRVPHPVGGTQPNPPNADITTKTDRAVPVVASRLWRRNTPRRMVRRRRRRRTQKTHLRRSVQGNTGPRPTMRRWRSQISKSHESSASSFSSSTNSSGNSNIAGFASNRTYDSDPDTRRFLSGESKRSNVGLSDPFNVKKVVVLILATFLPGLFLGYLTVAIIFIVRNRRCLCLMEGCEGAFNKLFHLTPTRTISGSLPRLSMVQVSERHVHVPLRLPNIDIDRKLLDSQFQEDRQIFQRTGRDPYYDQYSDVDPQLPFKDSPDMTRKQWLRGRLRWWLVEDRRRALSGLFADPSGPPDDSPPSERGARGKYLGSDITSASLQNLQDAKSVDTSSSLLPAPKAKGNLFKAMVSNKGSYDGSVKSDDAVSVDDTSSVDSGEGSATSDDKDETSAAKPGQA